MNEEEEKDDQLYHGFKSQDLLVAQVSKYLLTLTQNSISVFPTPRMLDFGCGTGTLSRLMRPHVSEVVIGIDTSERAIRIFNQLSQSDKAAGVEGEKRTPSALIRGIRVDLLEDPTTTTTSVEIDPLLPLQDSSSSFNVVVTMLSFHHFPDMDHVLKVLAERMIRGAHLLIVDFFLGSGEEDIELSLSLDDQISACKPLYIQPLYRALDHQGFHIVNTDLTAIPVRMRVQSADRARDYKRRGFHVWRGKEAGYLVKGHLGVLWAMRD